MTTKEHWESVYMAKSEAEMSWTQAEPVLSLSLIAKHCPKGSVIDIGGGMSLLAENLVERGYDVAVLDVSEAALERARERTKGRTDRILWIAADVTSLPEIGTFEVWHDRAVFHFLTSAEDKEAYRALLLKTVPVGGHAIIATFALDGPEKCSGLNVARYNPETLAAEIGQPFVLVDSAAETHETPWGKTQSFQYSVFKRVH